MLLFVPSNPTLNIFFRISQYVLSALGSVLATIGSPEWVAITVALGQASQQWLRQNRIEERRVAYQQAAAELADARMKWEAVPMEERAIQRNIDILVWRVESAVVSVIEPLPTQVKCPALESLAHDNPSLEVESNGPQRQADLSGR